MVKVSTLFHRVNGFEELESSSTIPLRLDQDLGDEFLGEILSPLMFDPGEAMVKAVLEKI